jgi:plastocyanin
LLLGVLALAAFTAGCGGDDDDDATDQVQAPQPQGPYGGGGGAGADTGETTAEAPPKPGGDAPRAETVEMIDFAFEPAGVTVEVGGKVTWKNQGQAPHTATADNDSFDTGTVDAGKLKAETFDEAGTYAYICTIHPQMKGTVEVVE